MPNINFDIFFDQDFVNFTATRSQGAPKIKPEWKVRTAPKLPPKELPAPTKNSPRPAPKQKSTPGSRIEDVTDKAESTPAPKKNIPKLPPKAKAADKAK
ncbi:MAG: hypothetical protein M1827_002111 [Pycnora praestabilis]|nr:MAG: hypothetical protein M1827_002111 [Pycnora praestabilis]